MRPFALCAFPLALALTHCTGATQSDGGLDVVRSDAITDAALDVPHDAPTDSHVIDVPGDGGPSDPLDPAYAPTIDMNPAHYPANVWVTGSLYKVQTHATPGAVHWSQISAARNEFESFQVHVNAPTAAITLSVSMGDLTNARTGTTITAAANITVSRESYLNITRLSDMNGTLGVTPDALVPTQDRYVHEMRNAFPETVPMGETRSAWIDVLVPADAPSGYYSGTVTVLNGTATLATLPVVLSVWDFQLPSTSTLRSAFGLSWNGLCVAAYGGYANCSMFPGSGGSNDHGVELTHTLEAAFFLDRRITLSDVVYAGPPGGVWTSWDALYGPLLNGTAPTQLAAAQLTSLHYVEDITSATTIQSWVTHFTAQSWLPALFFYGCDEPPNGCSWPDTLTQAMGVQSASSSARYLLTANVSNITSHGLTDYVDILTPVVDEMDPIGGTDQRASYDSFLAMPNKSLFWYQSCDEHENCDNGGTPGGAESTWPSYMADASPVRNRIFQWLAYLERIQGELYYATDICWSTSCGGGTDPWQSIFDFGGNGDGTLFYPGTVAKIGGTTPVPVSSLRLEYIRDGMEDFEYLHILAMHSDDAFARSTSGAFITDLHTFSNDPTQLEAARTAIGTHIHHYLHP